MNSNLALPACFDRNQHTSRVALAAEKTCGLDLVEMQSEFGETKALEE